MWNELNLIAKLMQEIKKRKCEQFIWKSNHIFLFFFQIISNIIFTLKWHSIWFEIIWTLSIANDSYIHWKHIQTVRAFTVLFCGTLSSDQKDRNELSDIECPSLTSCAFWILCSIELDVYIKLILLAFQMDVKIVVVDQIQFVFFFFLFCSLIPNSRSLRSYAFYVFKRITIN